MAGKLSLSTIGSFYHVFDLNSAITPALISPFFFLP